jgi:hypothetical protein
MTEITRHYHEPDPFHEKVLRPIVEKRHYRGMWGRKYLVSPALCGTIWGDGAALFILSTINQRPWYYVVRGDSTWSTGSEPCFPHDAPDFVDFTDDILTALEEEFGSARTYDEEEEKEYERYRGREPWRWPALNDQDGCSWGRMDWPKIPGLETVPHPHTWRANLAKRFVWQGETPEQAVTALARWADDGGPVRDAA